MVGACNQVNFRLAPGSRVNARKQQSRRGQRPPVIGLTGYHPPMKSAESRESSPPNSPASENAGGVPFTLAKKTRHSGRAGKAFAGSALREVKRGGLMPGRNVAQPRPCSNHSPPPPASGQHQPAGQNTSSSGTNCTACQVSLWCFLRVSTKKSGGSGGKCQKRF